MFPEGDPTSAPMQEILYWQSNTMEVLFLKLFITKNTKVKKLEIEALKYVFTNF